MNNISNHNMAAFDPDAFKLKQLTNDNTFNGNAHHHKLEFPMNAVTEFKGDMINKTVIVTLDKVAAQRFKDNALARVFPYATPQSWEGWVLYPYKAGSKKDNILCIFGSYNPDTGFVISLISCHRRNWFFIINI